MTRVAGNSGTIRGLIVRRRAAYPSRATRQRIIRVFGLCTFVGCGGATKDITPPPPRDTTAPTVTATTPADGTADAAPNVPLSITFSEPLNPATLTTSSLTVSPAGSGAAALAGTVTLTGATGTFTPTTPLAASTRYTATISTAVKDLAGNSLATEYVWNFTTATPPDITAPTVIGNTPLSDAVNVAVTVAPTVTMSEAMNPTTFNATTIVLTKAGDVTPIAGTVSVSGNTATFQPASTLSVSTKYTLTVSTGAKDVAGNALAAAATSSFTTVQPPTPDIWRNPDAGDVFYRDNAGRIALDVAGRLLTRQATTRYAGIDLATGAVAWTTTQPFNQFEPWTFGSLFQISGVFVDPATGATLWTPDQNTSVSSALMVIGETIILGLQGDTVLTGVERRTGREKWRVRLRPHACPSGGSCGILRPIGVDGANGYLLRTSSAEAQIITLSETGVVREVVAASETVRRAISPNQLSVVRGTNLVVAWTLNGMAAGVDAVTGAERWMADLSTLAAGFLSNPTSRTFYTPDGTLLFLEFDGISEAEAVLQLTLNAGTGSVASRRVLSLQAYRPGSWSRCGAEGLAHVTDVGMEYTNLRTGTRTTVPRAGLLDALAADFVTDMYPIGTDRVLFTRSNGNAPLTSVKCTP